MQQEGLIQQVGAITIMAIFGHFLGPSTAILNKKVLYRSVLGNMKVCGETRSFSPSMTGQHLM